MILTPQTLFALLVLAPFINASRSNIQHDSALASINGPAKDIAEQLATINLHDNGFEGNIAAGAALWTKNLGSDMTTIIKLLDSEIDEMAKQSSDFNSAAALIQGFLDASASNVNAIVKIALSSHAFSLLRTLQYFFVWASPEQFHWFLALGYRSKWYDPLAWGKSPIPVDWDANLKAVFEADNPLLLGDIRTGKVPSKNFLAIKLDTLLDLVAEYDSVNIYRALNFTFHDEFAGRLEILIKSDSFKLLRYLHDTKTINLNFEEYPPPQKLPDSVSMLEFFWMQGYRYLPATHFLFMACEYGRVDILEYLYQLNPQILVPCPWYITLAAKNGHLNVLEWALNRKLPTNDTDIIQSLILREHFDIFERLERMLTFPTDCIQNTADRAVESNNLTVVRWLHGKFTIIPRSESFADADIKMLEWVESIDLQIINENLAKKANLNNLNWILKNHPHVLTDGVKRAHANTYMSLEKLEWMLLQKWMAIPDMGLSAARGELETFEFLYNRFQGQPNEYEAYTAASHGHIKLLEWIHSVNPACITTTALSNAVARGNLEAAKYLESILNLKGTVLHIDAWTIFCNDLEAIKWAYQTYKLEQPKASSLMMPIKVGRLDIIDWVLKSKFILKTDELCLSYAAQYNRHLIFQRLIDYGIVITKVQDLLKLAFESASLNIVKYLVTKDPKSVQILENQKISDNNHHIIQWLLDHEYLKSGR